MAQLYPKADPEGVQGVQSNPLSTPTPPRFKISYQNRITWYRRDQIISFSRDNLRQMRSNQQCDHTQIHTRMHARTHIPHPPPHRTRSTHVLTHTLDLQDGGQKVKINLLKVVKLHIKLMGMEHRAPCKHIFCTHPGTLSWVKGQNIFFLKEVILHIKLMRMEHRAPCKQIFCPCIHPQSLAWGHKAIKFVLLKVLMLHIKLKGLERREPYKAILCPL